MRIYRWSAVVLGFVGVLVMLWPHFDPSRYARPGDDGRRRSARSAGSTGAIINAGAVIQTRRLTDTETTSSIVFYFSLFCALAGLATLPFGWIMPTPTQLVALIATGLIGGLSHIFLTESYRNAPQSVVAPFDYSTMLWALVFGYLFLGEIPTADRAGRRQHRRGRRTVRGVPRAPARQARHRRAAADTVTDQNALKVMMVSVSWMPGMTCTFSFTKWPISTDGST